MNHARIESRSLRLAVTAALLAGAPYAESVAGTTAYNTFNHSRAAPHELASGGTGTDGWLRSDTSLNPVTRGDGPACGNAGDCGESVPWVGFDPRDSVAAGGLGYTSVNVLHWVAILSGAGDSAVISREDSAQRYGGTLLSDGTEFLFADIDTAKGAWHDNVSTGWRHDLDIGLFRSDVEQDVTLSIASLLTDPDGNLVPNETPDYGITVFKGMSANAAGFYNHHGGWHAVTPAVARGAAGSGPDEPVGIDITPANPVGGSGLLLADRVLDDVLGNNAVFHAEAGQIYTIFIGGFQGGDWTTTRNDYRLSFTTSPVPVPGAVWLFGSALAGLAGLRRRRAGAA